MENKSQLGGIFSIISGGIGILSGIGIGLFMIFMFRFITFDIPSRAYQDPTGQQILNVFSYIYAGFGLALALIGVLGLVGGIFAVRKKHWGWALAGAIASVITFMPLGVLAIIFISMGRPEFLNPQPAKAQPPQI